MKVVREQNTQSLRVKGAGHMPVITAGHIEVDENGVARIDGSRMKVKHIAVENSQGMSVEEIQKAHPFLSLAQIYAALSYYHDHKAELDAEIERSYKEYVALWEADRDSPVKTKLRALGLIP